MEITARLLEVEKNYIELAVSDRYDNKQSFDEQDIKFSCPGVESLYCHQLTTGGIIILDACMEFSQPVTDRFEIKGDSIMMEFMFNTKQNVEPNIDELEWIKSYEANTHNVIYSSNFNGRFKMLPNHPVVYFIVLLSRDFYFKLIPEWAKLHKEFSTNISRQHTCTLYDTHLPFNPAIYTIIQDIRNCQREGELKRLYIENKIQELLLLQLELYKHQHLLSEQAGLTDEDLLKLKQVKQVLDDDFRSAPGIADLSKMVYLNEFKLKKGFKACYGTTIKSYVIALKMKHAMTLLEKDKHNISEIAFLCGYNGLVQFSAAFKTFYGCSPKAVQSGGTQARHLLDFHHNCPLCHQIRN